MAIVPTTNKNLNPRPGKPAAQPESQNKKKDSKNHKKEMEYSLWWKSFMPTGYTEIYLTLRMG